MASPFKKQGSDPSLSIDNERFSFLKSYLVRQGSSQISLTSLLPDADSVELLSAERQQQHSPVPNDTVVYDPSPDFKRKFAASPAALSRSRPGSGRDILAAMSPIPDDEGDGSSRAGVGDSGTKRRRKIQWTQTEDITILAAARALGSQWDRIAAHLPGRTSDAVRNRFHRLQKSHFVTTEEGRSVVDGALAATGLLPAELLTGSHLPGVLTAPGVAAAAGPSLSSSSTHVAGGGGARGGEATTVTGRSHWTEEEDRTIADGVAKFGCKWRQIAALLPGRTDSSVRNRWVRLQQQLASGGGDDLPSTSAAALPSTTTAPATPPGKAGADLSLFSSATPMSEAPPTPAAAGGANKPTGAPDETPMGTEDMSDRALADALAEFAGVDASAEPCVAADGAVLPLGLRQPELVIDLEDFVSAVHSLKEGSSVRGSSCREDSMRSDDLGGSFREASVGSVGASSVLASSASANHGAPPGVKLASAFLATFAAMAIGNLAKR